jgi:O-antigen/teichoic acid export membrane protein
MNQTWTRYLPAFIQQKLEGRHALQQAIDNTGWLTAEKVLRIGVGLFVNVWIARYLGPDKYGLLSYALAFVTLFLPLVTLGLDEIVVRNIVREPGCANETLGTAFILKLIGGALSFITAIIAAFILRPTDTLSHWLVGIIAAGSLFQSLNIIDIWFNSQVQSKYPVLARNVSFIICALIRVTLLMTDASLIAFAVVITLETGIGSGGLIVAYWRQGGRFKEWQPTFEKAKKLLGDSWPLIISFISVGIYQRIDQVMLREMKGSTEVGIYSVAVRLTEVWAFIPTAIYWSAFPSIVAAKQVSEELFYERLQKLYNLVVLLSYAVAIPTAATSQWLVDTLFGQAYTAAGSMVAWLVWAQIFTSLEIARCAFLTAMNWNKIYFLSVFLGCCLNVVLCYYLIPHYGAMGAVVASVFAYWFAAHGSCFMFKRTYKTGFMLSKALMYPKVW